MKKFFILFLIFILFSCNTKAQNDTDSYIEILLENMTLEEKIGQLFIIRPESIDPTMTLEDIYKLYDKGVFKVSNGIRDKYNYFPAGGFAIFNRNIISPEQIRILNDDLHKLGKIRPLIFVDEEGGKVARLANHKNFNLPKYESMEEIGNTKNPKNAFEAGQKIGSYLKKYGFDVNFAPIADVNTNPDNPIIGNRAFGSEPILVGKMNIAFLLGLNENGIQGCLKHFPGHGDTQTDTHKGYAETKKTWEELKNCEMVSFIEGIQNGAKMIMTAHIAAPNVDFEGLPSTLSKVILTKKLRNELGFDGLIITDAMEMKAITKFFPPKVASVMAIQAGVDLVLMPYDYETSFKSVLLAVKTGSISEERINESVRRILKFKSQFSIF